MCCIGIVHRLERRGDRPRPAGERDGRLEAAPSDLSLAVQQVAPVLTVTQVAPTDSALTSTEQGQTTDLDESFGDFRDGAWKSADRP